MSVIINAKDLTRVYRSYKKESGLAGTMKSLFKRQWVDHVAVDAISFSVNSGEFVGFLGPNGAGKTTTLKILSGILQPTNGSASVLGYNPTQRKTEFKKKISLVMGQKSQLIWDLPATDTFLLHKTMYQLDEHRWKKTMNELVEILQLSEAIHRPVRQLSLGERMKCEIIVSLLHAPMVLFLDEPTIGLDAVSQKHLWDFLRSYQKTQGTTIMLTSHYMQDIANLCSRVIVINEGKLVFDDTLDELIDATHPEKRITARFSKNLSEAEQKKLRALSSNGTLEEVDPFTYSWSSSRATFATTTAKLLQEFSVEDLQVNEADLSTVMQRSFDLRSHS